MDALRTLVINELKDKLPDIAAGIRSYAELLDEQSDKQISYPAGSVLVSILPVQEAPIDLPPWELRANWGVVVTGTGVSREQRDKDGWKQAMRVARVIYRNCWSLQRSSVTPAIITSIQKNEQRDKEGSPTGVNYWTITFYNYCRFTATLGEPEY